MTKLCPRGKAAAKRKFKVYPSAYANAYASKICAGKIKDPSGVKRKDFKGPKPAAEGAMINKPKKLISGGFGIFSKKKDKPKQVKEDSRETNQELRDTTKDIQEDMARLTDKLESAMTELEEKIEKRIKLALDNPLSQMK